VLYNKHLYAERPLGISTLWNAPFREHFTNTLPQKRTVFESSNFLGAPSLQEGCCLLSPLIPPDGGVQKLRIQLKIQSVRLKRKLDVGFIVEPSIPSGWVSTRNCAEWKRYVFAMRCFRTPRRGGVQKLKSFFKKNQTAYIFNPKLLFMLQPTTTTTTKNVFHRTIRLFAHRWIHLS
jgi:hypothetical protein